MTYFKIYNWMLHDLGLRGNELLVYAYLYSWNGKELLLTNGELAANLRMQKTHFSAYLRKLQERGLLSYQNGNKKVTKTVTKSYQNGNNKVTKMVTSSYQNGNSTINIHNNIHNIIQDRHRAREEKTEEKTDPIITRSGIIIETIAKQYADRGEAYIPNYVTQTTAARSLVGKVTALMQHFNIADTDEQFAITWQRFLDAGFSGGDQFQCEHWELGYIDNNFQKILNQLNNNGKQSVNNSGKGQRRVSDEYMRRLMQQAGIAVQSGGTR